MALVDDLVSYWTLNEASGTRNDSHGTNHLTDNNTVASNTGKVGNAAEFVGASSEYLSKAYNASLTVDDAVSFSFAGWVYLDSTAGLSTFFASAGAYTPYGLAYDNVGGASNLRFDAYFNNTTLINGALSTGTWYFLAAGHDAPSSQTWMQVNGGTRVTTADGGFAVTDDAAGPFYIGRSAAGEYLSGRVDELGFWKRYLSSAEVIELYNSGSGRDYAYISGGGGGAAAPSRLLTLGVG